MLTYFPTPYQDETLYSIFARYHIHMGNVRYKHSTLDLFGKASKRAVYDLPSGIGSFIEQLGKTAFTVDELLGHTFFPFYAPFLPIERAKKVREEMVNGKGEGIQLRSGIAASKVTIGRTLKHCRDCVKEDLQMNGETYWHNIHQLPGIFVCPHHRKPLLAMNKKMYAYSQHSYVAATIDHIDKMAPLHYDKEIEEELMEYAKSVWWLINRDVGSFPLSYYRDRYIARLQNIGLATPVKRVYQEEWVEKIRKRYSPRFLEMMESEIDDSAANWTRMIVQKHRKSFHPIRHILVIQLLYKEIEEFYETEDAYLPFGKGPWLCLNPVHHKYKQRVVDDLKITLCCDTKKPVGTFKCDCGFVYSRRGPDQAPADAYRIGTLKEFGMVWKGELKKRVDEGLKMTEIAHKMKADPLTIKRQAALMGLEFPWEGQPLDEAKKMKRYQKSDRKNQHEEKEREVQRENWKELIEANPGLSIKKLRAVNKGLFAWLYRNDKEWLEANSPKMEIIVPVNKRVEWKTRDYQTLQEVKAIIDDWEKEGLKRVTLASVAKRMDKPYRLLKKSEKLPETMKFLEEHLESVEEFQKRRIDRACDRLRETEGNVVKEWKVYLAANILKKKASENIRKYIEGKSTKQTL